MSGEPLQAAPKVCLVIGAGDGVGGAIAKAFHAEHLRLYGYALEGEATPVEIIQAS